VTRGNLSALKVLIERLSFHRSHLSYRSEYAWALMVAVGRRDLQMLEYLWQLPFWRIEHCREVLEKLKRPKKLRRAYFTEGIQLILKSQRMHQMYERADFA
jgi:hypothetical protein